MELLAEDPARLSASDSAVPVPTAFRPLLLCLFSLQEVYVQPTTMASQLHQLKKGEYASAQERDAQDSF